MIYVGHPCIYYMNMVHFYLLLHDTIKGNTKMTLVVNEADSILHEVSMLHNGLIIITGPNKDQNRRNMDIFRKMFGYMSLYVSTTFEVGAEKDPNNEYSYSYDDLMSPESKSMTNSDNYWEHVASLTENAVFREFTHRQIIFEDMHDSLIDIAIDCSRSIFLTVISIEAESLDKAIEHISDVSGLDVNYFKPKIAVVSHA